MRDNIGELMIVFFKVVLFCLDVFGFLLFFNFIDFNLSSKLYIYNNYIIKRI